MPKHSASSLLFLGVLAALIAWFLFAWKSSVTHTITGSVAPSSDSTAAIGNGLNSLFNGLGFIFGNHGDATGAVKQFGTPLSGFLDRSNQAAHSPFVKTNLTKGLVPSGCSTDPYDGKPLCS